MWSKVKKKLYDVSVNVSAYTIVAIITALVFLVPITLICGCIKLIIMMFGV